MLGCEPKQVNEAATVLIFSLPMISAFKKFACSNLSRGRLSDDHVDVLAAVRSPYGEHPLGHGLGDVVRGDLDDLLLYALVERFANLSHLIF
jgi:hypothetical protein